MALRNGLPVHGPTHWAAAVRTKNGELKVASGRKPDLGARHRSRAGSAGRGEAGGGHGGDPAREAGAAGGPAPDAGREDARLDGRRGARRPGDPHGGSRTGPYGGPRGGGCALEPRAGAAGAAERRSGGLPRRRAQGDRRLRGRPDAADADKEHDRCGSHLVAPMLAAAAVGNVACAAPGCAGRPPRPPSGSAAPRWPWRCSPGASAIPTRRSPGDAPPRLRDPARRRHARADRGAARGRQGRAAEILRVEGGQARVASSAPTRSRLDPEVFRLPVERIREGYYSDAYFNLTRGLLRPTPATGRS